MKYIQIIFLILISNSIIYGQCDKKKDFMQDIVAVGEEYLMLNHSKQAPYKDFLYKLEQIEFISKNQTQYDSLTHLFYKKLSVLLHKSFKLAFQKNECLSYFYSLNFTMDGRIYFSYNIQDNGYLFSLKGSPNLFLDYANAIIDSGDLPPSQIAGTTKWKINQNSSIEDKFLFLSHIMIITHKYAYYN